MKSAQPTKQSVDAFAQAQVEQVKRLKNSKLTKKYEITVRRDSRGSWKFTFHGHLSWWQGFLITLAGWDIREVA